MNWFKYIFFPNWKVLYSESAKWIIDNEPNIPLLRYTSIKLVYYEILYSEIRDVYKIKCKGHKAKEHPMYKSIVDKLNQFQK